MIVHHHVFCPQWIPLPSLCTSPRPHIPSQKDMEQPSKGPVVLLSSSSSSSLYSDDLNPKPGLVGPKPEDYDAQSGLQEDPKERFPFSSSNMLISSTSGLSNEPSLGPSALDTPFGGNVSNRTGSTPEAKALRCLALHLPPHHWDLGRGSLFWLKPPLRYQRTKGHRWREL